MEVKTKYSIGQTIGFNEYGAENKVIIATITEIRIHVDEKGVNIFYDTDYPTMDYEQPSGVPYMSTVSVAEDRIIGVAEITFV